MAIATAAELVNALRQCRVLEPDQEEAARALQTRFPEPRAFARELLQRGWLTAYQVNQLLQDGGRSLLLRGYVVLERLGEGGTGQVFKARHLKLQRIVALKVIRPELLTDPDVVNRFHREIQVASQVAHPNVVHAYDAEDVDGSQTLVLEYVEGVSLDCLVKDGSPLPATQACEYVRQVALGLQHIHECGLVHRDVKPSNLLVTGRVGTGDPARTRTTTPRSQLTTQPIVKILDLGLARLRRTRECQDSATLTTVGTVMMGTPDYMAPEQALDFHAADIRADIYSLGCTFYFLLTGQPPFPGGTLAQKLMRHQQAEPPPLARLRPGLPANVEAILRKMLSKKPQKRYQTPGEAAQALAALQQSGAAEATLRLPRPGAATVVVRGRQRRWLLPLLAGMAALLLVGPLMWWLLTAAPRRDSEANQRLAVGPTTMRSGEPRSTMPAVSPTTVQGTVASVLLLVRGRGVVNDALLDPTQPDRRFGAEPKDNRVYRTTECGAFLVRFELSRVTVPVQKLDKATVSFFVWDPHDKAVMKVCAFPLLTAWDEASVTWKEAAVGKPWKGGKNFTYGVDTGPPSPHVVVQPDKDTDTVDPPLEYQLDVTPMVRSWLAGNTPNHGLAIAPVIDRAIDQGFQSRFQMYGSEHNRVQYTPTLTIRTQP